MGMLSSVAKNMGKSSRSFPTDQEFCEALDTLRNHGFKVVLFRGYTPTFNDGDPCEHWGTTAFLGETPGSQTDFFEEYESEYEDVEDGDVSPLGFILNDYLSDANKLLARDVSEMAEVWYNRNTEEHNKTPYLPVVERTGLGDREKIEANWESFREIQGKVRDKVSSFLEAELYTNFQGFIILDPDPGMVAKFKDINFIPEINAIVYAEDYDREY